MAELAAEDVPKLKLAWAFAFDGVNRAYAQPTIVGGRLFVGSANGKVYSLDAKTGCLIWIFEASAPVRTAISIGIDAPCSEENGCLAGTLSPRPARSQGSMYSRMGRSAAG